MGIVDGPTEVHRAVLGKQILKRVEPVEGLLPSDHVPTLLKAAYEKYGEYFAQDPVR